MGHAPNGGEHFAARSTLLFTPRHPGLQILLQTVHPGIGMAPGIAQELGVEGHQLFLKAGELQKIGAFGNEQPDGELHRGHAFHDLQFHEPLQQGDVAFQCRPGGEGNKGRGERDAGFAGKRHRPVKVPAGMVLGEQAQDVVVYSFHCGGDEQATAAPQLGKQFDVIDDVLNFDGGIEGDVGECCVQGARQPEAMGGTVKEVRVAERNMGCAFSDLLPDVLHHYVCRNDAELPLVHRDHGAVPAQVLAAPAALGKPGYAGRSVRQHQVGVAGELRQAAAVRHHERDPAQADDRFALDHRRSIGP